MAKMIQKTTAFERFVHLFMAVSGCTLFLSGLGFLSQEEIGWLNNIFGGPQLAKGIHNWGGVVFIVSLVLSLGLWLKESLKFTKEDKEWFGMLGGYLKRGQQPPPQGKLNAGQKGFMLVTVFFGFMIGISGLMMWLFPLSRGIVMLGVLLHNIAFLFFVVAIPLHIYLATIANPGTFRIMTKGTVPLYWAKKKHAKWIEEIGAK